MAFIQFQFRRGLAADWTSADPILAEGEMGIETDTKKYKIGDGATVWSLLDYNGLGLSGYSGFSGLGSSGFSGYSSPGTSGYSGFSAASPGASGYSGFSGKSGYSGFSGAGESGYSGFSGLGESGYSGYSSSSGYSGYSGFSGQSGYSGYSGSGLSGYSGYSGAGTSGYSGYSSFSGYSGYSGFSSQSGYSGYSGTAGSIGVDGASGYSGYSAYSGFSGYSGFSSTSGFSGFSGPSGYSGYSAYSGYSGKSGYSGFSGPQLLTFSTQTDTDYTLVLGDANTGVNMSSASAHNLTIPLNATVAFAVGTQIPIEQGGAGLVTIVATGGVTLNGATVSTGQYSVVALVKTATDTWLSVRGGVSGYSGYSGPSGYSGYSGYSGKSGYSGYSGSGLSGYSGYSGLSGYSGYSGSNVQFAVAAGQAVTQQTLQNITGLSFSLVSGTYIFEACLNGNCATGTAGCQIGINMTANFTSADYQAYGTTTGAAIAACVRGTANNTATGTFMTTSAAEGYVGINGQIVVSGAGTFTIQALKVTSQTFTVRAGSWCWIAKVA